MRRDRSMWAAELFHQRVADERELRLAPAAAVAHEQRVPIAFDERLHEHGWRLPKRRVFIEHGEHIAQGTAVLRHRRKLNLRCLQLVEPPLQGRVAQPNQATRATL